MSFIRPEKIFADQVLAATQATRTGRWEMLFLASSFTYSSLFTYRRLVFADIDMINQAGDIGQINLLGGVAIYIAIRFTA